MGEDDSCSRYKKGNKLFTILPTAGTATYALLIACVFGRGVRSLHKLSHCCHTCLMPLRGESRERQKNPNVYAQRCLKSRYEGLVLTR